VTTLYPLTFHPIFKERIWGGRNLERLYDKSLPSGVPIGESWEISDRPGDVSVIANGPLAGKDLRWLMEYHQSEVLGSAKRQNGRFPLLIKLLDAQETLSLQVHPPAHKASELGGEPKTEMWYVADAAPRAELFVGLKPGVTRAEFERRLEQGTVAECFHRIAVKRGDAMFLPSGRVHAIGAGLVLFEIQQNSDTTYRVFDWNRPASAGRELHVAQSLASIDFNDFEPRLVESPAVDVGPLQWRDLTRTELFNVSWNRLRSSEIILLKAGLMQIVGVLEKEVELMYARQCLKLSAGQFGLVPAACSPVDIHAPSGSSFLNISL
jgi:mannose-6-phosphate isomerase